MNSPETPFYRPTYDLSYLPLYIATFLSPSAPFCRHLRYTCVSVSGDTASASSLTGIH